MGFILNSCFAELLSSQALGGELKLKLATFCLQVEDAIAAVMKDPILPGVRSVARHVKENGGGRSKGGLRTLEVRSGGHELRLFDEPNITPRGCSGTKCGQLLNWHTNDHFLNHL